MSHFVDETRIEVSSGSGGRGSVSFRREKYVPFGGPDGGDGGRGGDIVFVVRNNLKTLVHLRKKTSYHAQNGQPGSGGNCHGKDGESVVLPVPPGTLIRDAKSGEILHELLAIGDELVFLQGGMGGKGNAHFKSSRHQAPRFAQPGIPGQQADIIVELQLMADIGLVGLPNAGKSSLLKMLSNANPKVAPYPFTTKIPNLGVCKVHDHEMIIADIPGLIEGASHGAGLGFTFLRHISRTAGLAILIDLSDDAWQQAWPVLMHELSSWEQDLSKRPAIVVGTKLDLPEARDRFDDLRKMLPDKQVIGISALTNQGLEELTSAMFVLANRNGVKNQE